MGEGKQESGQTGTDGEEEMKLCPEMLEQLIPFLEKLVERPNWQSPNADAWEHYVDDGIRSIWDELPVSQRVFAFRIIMGAKQRASSLRAEWLQEMLKKMEERREGEPQLAAILGL